MTDNDTTATAGPAPSDEPLILTQHVAAPRDAVFEFLVVPEKVLRWMGTAIDIDPRAGGRFWMNANGQDIATGIYREVVRPERMVFTFGWEGSEHVPEGSTTVTISLAAEDDGTTTVELRHDGLPFGPADAHAQGWTHLLGRLAIAAPGGDPDAAGH
ncbi:MAG: SRPBCC domain-containing protein [Actinomycetota bacterium]